MGTRARREREKDERRRDILDQAKAIFRRNGYSGTTMRQIASACELAAGTIYLHYRDKNELFAELVIEGHDLLIKRLEKALGPTLGRDSGERMTDAFIDFAVAYPEYFELMFFVAQREGRGVLDVVEDTFSDTYLRLKKQQQRCLELAFNAIRASAPEADEAEVMLTAEAAWSMIAGVVHFFLKEGQSSFLTVSRQARKILVSYFQIMGKSAG